jgi:hypothetical protein
VNHRDRERAGDVSAEDVREVALSMPGTMEKQRGAKVAAAMAR